MSDRIVFWQNQPSLHFAPLISALSDRGDLEVVVVAEDGLANERRLMGWAGEFDHGSANVVVAPNDAVRHGLEEDCGPGSFNIFSGLGTYPKTTSSLVALRSRSAVAAVFSEPWDPRGLKGPLRQMRYRRRLRSHDDAFDLMFTTGRLGAEQFRKIGLSSGRVVPFVYTVRVPEATGPSSWEVDRIDERFHVVFVGKLEARKRVRDLLRALGGCTHLDWRLSIVGDGPMRGGLTRTAAALGIAERTGFAGSVPNDLVRAQLQTADLLVLPSGFDGWGAVVNEALHSGVPCLVSDMVGAGDLLSSRYRGDVFPVGNIQSLRRLLEWRVVQGPLTSGARTKVSDWANRSIAPDVVAEFLLSRLRSGPDAGGPPPWSSL